MPDADGNLKGFGGLSPRGQATYERVFRAPCEHAQAANPRLQDVCVKCGRVVRFT